MYLSLGEGGVFIALRQLWAEGLVGQNHRTCEHLILFGYGPPTPSRTQHTYDVTSALSHVPMPRMKINKDGQPRRLLRKLESQRKVKTHNTTKIKHHKPRRDVNHTVVCGIVLRVTN
ncbi:uncharacterized protein G2W53_033938 [Senna tora]|uniref:Uncharacterized protein n=1 Tax=Senna tora TaxID=362788 RepID=A0A834W8F9_9FABA|nr:uncharacterized protein G2W53_033938 [Senna tora]